MTSETDNVTLAKRWFEEVWNQQKADLVHELVLPTSVCHTDAGDMVGPAPFLAYHAQMIQAMPDLKVAIEDILADGDRVSVLWSATGKHSGPFQGKPGTGKSIRFQGVTWIRYEKGKMVEGWDCWNIDGLMKQLSG